MEFTGTKESLQFLYITLLECLGQNAPKNSIEPALAPVKPGNQLLEVQDDIQNRDLQIFPSTNKNEKYAGKRLERMNLPSIGQDMQFQSRIRANIVLGVETSEIMKSVTKLILMKEITCINSLRI
jgi:hypothetical protein